MREHWWISMSCDMELTSFGQLNTLFRLICNSIGVSLSSFRPDFVLVRQYIRDINIDWTNIILGMQYGAVPSVNSMKALYNFRDKPWIVGDL